MSDVRDAMLKDAAERKEQRKRYQQKWFLENHMTKKDWEKLRQVVEHAKKINEALKARIKKKAMERDATGYGYVGRLSVSRYG